MKGIDRWSGSTHEIRATVDGVFVYLSVEATSGASAGEVMITPGQARSLAKYLQALAEEADAAASTELEAHQ